MLIRQIKSCEGLISAKIIESMPYLISQIGKFDKLVQFYHGALSESDDAEVDTGDIEERKDILSFYEDIITPHNPLNIYKKGEQILMSPILYNLSSNVINPAFTGLITTPMLWECADDSRSASNLTVNSFNDIVRAEFQPML